MAKLRGTDAAYLLKAAEIAVDFKEIVASTTIEEDDVTGFQASARSYIPGYTDGEHSLRGMWESGAGSSHEVLQDLLDDSAAAVATICPQGVTEGTRAMLLSASITRKQDSAPGGHVAIEGVMIGAGGAKWGQLIKVGAISASGNGTGYDNPSDGATTKGAAFHLHVTANTRDAGTLDVKIQDSADNSSFADITGLTAFTQIAGGASPSSERKTLANGVTLRRYVRVVVTVAAGSTGTYTIRVAYSRYF